MVDRIWTAIAPTKHETRILATAGPGDTLLKARLSPRMKHPRALASLLEGLALWQGLRVHAVIAVDAEQPSFDWNPSADFGGYEETPLYVVDYALTTRRQRRELTGLGDFSDLHRVLAIEVAQ